MSSSPQKLRIAILDDYQGAALRYGDFSPLKDRADITVFTDNILGSFTSSTSSFEPLVKRLEPFDVICTTRERTKIRKEVLDRLPNLKLLTTMAMRNRGIDVEYTKELGIVMSGTPYTADNTTEHNWTLIMATVRGLVKDHNAIANGNPQWQTQVPGSLAGKTLGILGLGRIGTDTAKLGQVFGMKIQAWSPNLTAERCATVPGVAFCPSKSDFFATSDVISVHIVEAPSTRDLITYADLSLMKPNAHLVNTSRGPIVNEKDLLRALEEEKIGGAALDTFDMEPLPLDHPLRKAKNVTLTPHSAYVSEDVYKVWWSTTAQNVIAFMDGKPQNIMNGLEYADSRAAKLAAK